MKKEPDLLQFNCCWFVHEDGRLFVRFVGSDITTDTNSIGLEIAVSSNANVSELLIKELF